MCQQLLPLRLVQLMDDAHAVEELAALLGGAPQLHHGVRDGHDLAKDHVVHAAHRHGPRVPVHVVPGFLVGNRLQLRNETKRFKCLP